jgi:hypothetical protein
MSTNTPATYKLTRKKTSKPASAMRVLITPPEGSPDFGGGLAAGGTFYFEPGDSHAIPGEAAAAFMADAYHADHFDIDPPLPKAKAPADDAAAEGKKVGGK